LVGCAPKCGPQGVGPAYIARPDEISHKAHDLIESGYSFELGFAI
jgi:hypothetical protein